MRRTDKSRIRTEKLLSVKGCVWFGDAPSMQKQTIISWVLQVVVAVILGQTLFFKFMAHPESVELFTKLGWEPAGRILIGLAELVAVALILYPKTIAVGGVFSAAIMAGALASHVTTLGFQGTYGELAVLATVALIAAGVVSWLRKGQLLPLYLKVRNRSVAA